MGRGVLKRKMLCVEYHRSVKMPLSYMRNYNACLKQDSVSVETCTPHLGMG